MHFNRLTTSAPQYDDYDEDYDDDDEETYDEDDQEEDEAAPKSKDADVVAAASTSYLQANRGKLDSYQFEIVAQSIRRFDNYLEFTRGRDSDYAKNKNLRRDDYSEDEYEDRSPRGGGRFLQTGTPRSAPRRGQGRSPAPPGLVTRPSDRSERLRRDPGIDERRERPRGDRRTPEPDEFEEDFVKEVPVDRRRRGGALAGAVPRNRPRGHDDYDEYLDQGRYR